MKGREKLLALVVGILGGLFLLNLVYGFVDGLYTDRNNSIAALNKELADKQIKIERGNRAAKKLKDWNHRSLPSEQEMARSLYKDWLLKLVEKVKLGSADVHELTQHTVRRTGADAYEQYSFNVKGETDMSLRSFVMFLYDFYSANHLQRVSRLVVTPRPEAKKLSVEMDIEALSLAGADRRDTLNPDKTTRLELGDLAAYEKTISGRNLFTEYTAPKEHVAAAPPPEKPNFDPAKFAEVTGIVEQNAKPELWVLVKSTGKLLKLTEGEEFTVGDMTCKVVSIGPREAILMAEGKEMQVKLGDNLRDAAHEKHGQL